MNLEAPKQSNEIREELKKLLAAVDEEAERLLQAHKHTASTTF